MMHLIQYYREQSDGCRKKLDRLCRRRNIVTVLKLMSFVLVCGMLYWFATGGGMLTVVMGLTGILVFIGLTVADSKVVRRITVHKELLIIYRTEINYLEGNLNELEKGETYFDAKHAYANDLDILGENSVFQHINRTVTPGGLDLLANWLLYLCRDKREIVERQKAVEELTDYPDWCHRFRSTGKIHQITGESTSKIKEWTEEKPFFSRPVNIRVVYALNAITLVVCALSVFTVLPYSMAMLFCLLQLCIMLLFFGRINGYYKRLGDFVRDFGNYFYLIRVIHEQSFISARMQQISARLFEGNSNSLIAFGELYRLLEGFEQRNNMLVGIFRNALYMSDFHFLIRLDKWRKRYAPEIESWLCAMNETDVLVSMANYRFNHPAYTVPVVSEMEWMKGTEMGHPLLAGEKCVKNNFSVESVHQFHVVTGANMAGKSTFLRTVGVNLVLALSGNVVCCRTFEFQLMTLFTSMRTTDNLSEGTSYFHAELLRLQQLIRVASESERLFIILDEMLKGTNSQDKLNGSLKFLVRLLDLPVSGIVATHDLALGNLAESYPDHFFNQCFEISHNSESITYDYKLKPGVSLRMNASILLEQMGLI